MEIPEYTLEDFLGGTEPYEFVLNTQDTFEQQQAIELLTLKLKGLNKNANFKALLKAYAQKTGRVIGEHYTEFTGQPVKLNVGTRYTATDSGVKYITESSNVTVCMHPLLPVARLVNVDTEEHGLEIAYRHEGQAWRTMAFPREDLASTNRIVSLAKYDIGVTSENAKAMCSYLNTIQELNHDALPEKLSINRFGWVGTDFVPYDSKYVFEGVGKYKQIFDSVHNHGSRDEWLDAVEEVRESDNVIPRIVMSASLASVLVKPLGALPFIVHLWGRTGTGKTLALMLAASIWADPEGGKFIHTFNATSVGMERIASFLHNLPTLLDELQTISKRADFEDIMYQLTEGTGRSRGAKDSSLRDTGQWANSVITTGEQPITRLNSGGGTVNRIIEVDCSNIDMFDDPHQFANVIRNNYGYLGEEFVQCLQKDGIMDIAKAKQENLRDAIYRAKPDVPEKQAVAASLILTADYIVTKFILHDIDNQLEVEDITPFLISTEDTEKDKRAYEWLCDWIAENQMHFIDDDTEDSEIRTQVYGRWLADNSLAIIRNVFNEECEKAGYNSTSLARWLKENEYTTCDRDKRARYDKKVRMSKGNCRCVVLKSAEQYRFDDVMDSEEVPW